MKTLIELLDEAKTVSGSDYKTAEKLSVRRQYLSDARRGKGFSVEKCRELAELIKTNPIEVIAAAEVAKHPERKNAWAKWVAAMVIMSMLGMSNNGYISKGYADTAINPFIHYTQLPACKS